ncbi:hypothetical protein B0H17DRAFT_1131441 [Mycena rosella]|uniref:Uncharacterized protein n=1 Tax=Mycena rosella TaxID=1033263 RepID=A0AAD7GKN1_MYCRO|nr:hypothetical protein B0H17DRAFT_1131441 [Mycena rosella]
MWPENPRAVQAKLESQQGAIKPIISNGSTIVPSPGRTVFARMLLILGIPDLLAQALELDSQAPSHKTEEAFDPRPHRMCFAQVAWILPAPPMERIAFLILASQREAAPAVGHLGDRSLVPWLAYPRTDRRFVDSNSKGLGVGRILRTRFASAAKKQPAAP